LLAGWLIDASSAQYGSSETQIGFPNPSVALICAALADDAVKNAAAKKKIFISFSLRYDFVNCHNFFVANTARSA